jgi:hypothetical protein
MLEDTVFSLANAGAIQVIAFVGFAISTIGFIVWVVWLVRE